MRVLIADDSAFMRRMLTKIFEAGRGFEVVGTARDGADAVKKCTELKPDVLTLDVEMPNMSGLEALRRIRADHGAAGPAVLMCSSLTESGSETALEALRLGASDVIAKEQLGLSDEQTSTFRAELLTKVRAIGLQARRARTLQQPTQRPVATASVPRIGELFQPGQLDLVAIGSSTGGPPVLETLVTAIQTGSGLPVVIAQHMPALFTKSLASRLDTVGPATVKLAQDGEKVERGHVYVAEGGKHLRVRRRAGRYLLEVSGEPADALYKPSVNELFASVAGAVGSRALGVVLTGMGDDGSEGARSMVQAGAKIVAQDEASCVVYGMPKAVTEGGLTSASMSPDQLGRMLAAAIESTQSGGVLRASA
ncbi:MAG: chemotaxis response regulator protein-glutamate methylesterase [Phycisphaeraceae bacterium]|nr:MAG: chemotaxis response regulator protein-glutamate methylesterase [Phycisphaeraceae bacterium]